ncbi:MAG: CoA transferase [Dehalococcoidia bacterium]|nr:CoA transferase [Dehalococcoidia bacterium]
MESKGPLSGIRVVEMTLMVAGPTCGVLLSHLGAEVIKIESAARGVQDRESWNWSETNAGKLGAKINLRHPEGIELLKQLIAKSDVFFYNMRQKAIDRLGLDPETLLREVNPNLVIMSMCGPGVTGPEKDFGGVATTFAALGGVSHLSGFPGAAPFEFIAWPDIETSNWATLALLSGLKQRKRTGKGLFIDVSANEGFTWLAGETFMDYAMNGRSPDRDGHWPPSVLQGVYPTRGELGEERYISIAAPTDEAWRALCAEIGDSALTSDPRFASVLERLQHRAEIDARIGAWTAGLDNVAMAERLQAKGIAAIPSYSSRELFESPHLQARHAFDTMTHSVTGKNVTLVGPPWGFSETPVMSRNVAPLLGQDNEYVFGEILGMPIEEQQRLTEAGILA